MSSFLTVYGPRHHSGAADSVHKLAKKKKRIMRPIIPQYGLNKQVQSRFLLLIMLYFEFPDSIASCSVNTTVNKKMKNYPCRI